MSAPHVSVVIPTRDRWPLLSESALRSALAQQGVDFEVIVVDDGSRDDTPDRVSGLGDSRVRLVRHESSLGVAAARNAGIAEARGTWIALLDDDDLWAPTKLARQLEAARASGADFVYCGALVLDERRRVIELSPAPAADGLHAELLRHYVIPAGASNVTATAALLQQVGGFDQRLSYLADWDMWLRLAAGGRAASLADFLVAYVRHPGRMLVAFDDVLRELDHVLAKHADEGLRIDPSRLVAWVAYQHRQAGRRAVAAAMFARSAVRFRRPRHAMRAGAALLDGPVAAAVRRLVRGPSEIVPPPEPAWLAGVRGEPR